MKHTKIIFISILCCICVIILLGKNLNTTITSNDTFTPPESRFQPSQAVEHVSYKDCTYPIHNVITIPNNAVFSVVEGDVCFGKIYHNIYELYEDAANIIAGKVVDITYSDKDALAKTYFSFAVDEVLKGDSILPATVITVMEMQGYCRLNEYVRVYGADHIKDYDEKNAENIYLVYTVAGEPMIQNGDEYVLFLGKPHNGQTGNGYYVTMGSFMGRYQKKPDSLYQRYAPEALYYQTFDAASGKSCEELPMTLDTIREKIAKIKLEEQE